MMVGGLRFWAVLLALYTVAAIVIILWDVTRLYVGVAPGLGLLTVVLCWVLFGAVGVLAFLIIGIFQDRKAWIISISFVIIMSAPDALPALTYQFMERVTFRFFEEKYSRAISDIELGVSADDVCTRFSHYTCAVRVGPPLQMVWTVGGGFDNGSALIYDPTGTYGRITGGPNTPESQALRGHLVPGVPLNCRLLSSDFYRCGWT